MLTRNTILHGDAFELLDRVKDGTIDLVLTDPPYGISITNSKNALGNNKTGLDFGEWDFGFDTERWVRKIANKPKRDKGQIIIFNSFHNVEVVARILEEYGYTVHPTPLYWIKTNPVPHFPDRVPISAMEHIIWATRGEDYVFNRNRYLDYITGRYSASSHEAQSQRFHTTQKPLKLWTPIMRVHSNAGDLVLDTFGGSGVTAVTATRLRRNFIVIEADDNYYRLSTERLNREKRKSKPLWF